VAEDSPSRGGFALQVFDATSPVTAVAGKRPYKLLPLISGDAEYWLGLELTFREDFDDVIVQAISLVVFRGRYAEAAKVPVLRAEWDGRWEDDHAQPHWHVYRAASSALRIDELRTFESTEAAKGPVVDPEPRDDLAHFHFAMSASWHAQPSGHRVTFPDMAVLDRWIVNCVGYIEGQLRYVEAKAG
jgi:hypothetical protein